MLHEETQSQWERYNPQSFIKTVLHGTIQDKIALAATVIQVYTQIMFQMPETDLICLSDSLPGDLPTSSLRDVFVTMRWNADEMMDVIQGGAATLPAQYTPALYITSMVRGLRGYAVNIYHCASALRDDPAAHLLGHTLPKGRSVRDVADEILGLMSEIMRFLNFAQYYVEKIRTCA